MVTAALAISALSIVLSVATIAMNVATTRRLRANLAAGPRVVEQDGFRYVLDADPGVRKFNAS